MSKLKKLYYHNIYGIIATLGIHLIIVSVLLLSQIRPLVKIPEETVFIDFSTVLAPVPEKTPEVEKEKAASQLTQNPAIASNGQNASNLGVNDASNEGTFSRNAALNNDAEIKAAQQLVADVNRSLSQKIPQIGDIPMPEDKQEGKTAEQVRQANYKGKSNIHYNLENRYHTRLPIPVYLAQGGGEVIVDIVVSKDGRVLSANPRINDRIKDMIIFAYAKQAAEKTEFNADPSAPDRQRGTISYMFVAQ
jgi:hypothetical protein